MTKNTKTTIMKNVVQIEDQTIEDELNHEGVVIVDFYADWCGPCKMLSPILDQVSEDNEGKVKVVKVNVDQHADLAQPFKVRGIPACFVFKGEEQVDSFVGAQTKAKIQEIVDKHLS